MQVDERIYHNTVAALLEVIAGVPPETGTLVIIGHNPSMHGLVVTISDGEGDPEAEAAARSDYPTCGIAVFDVRREWAELATGTATLRAFAAPRG